MDKLANSARLTAPLWMTAFAQLVQSVTKDQTAEPTCSPSAFTQNG
ncbi:hypothetical protein [Paenibacillus hunanensis]|nr:hypothetical protein [Paenibacillus hunanensis]